MISDGSAHAQTGVMRTIQKQKMACVTENESSQNVYNQFIKFTTLQSFLIIQAYTVMCKNFFFSLSQMLHWS